MATHRSRTEGAESRCPKRLEPKPKGLLRSLLRNRPSCSDKNETTPSGTDQPTDAKPLTSSDEGLVAGTVTGGGGKATKKRPNGTVLSGTNSLNLFILGADRDRLSAEEASGYKIGGSSVYM